MASSQPAASSLKEGTHHGGSQGPAAAGAASGGNQVEKKPSMWDRFSQGTSDFKDKTIESIKQSPTSRIERRIGIMSCITGILAIAIALYGFTVLPDCDGCWRAAYVIVELYTLLSGIFLIILEVIQQFYAHKNVNKKLSINFGFIYTYRGKGLFFIFIGTLMWSSISDTWGVWVFNIVTGALVIVFGVFVLVAYYVHPTLSKTSPGKVPHADNIQEPVEGKLEAPPLTTSETTANKEPVENTETVQVPVNTMDKPVKTDKEVESVNIIARWWRGKRSTEPKATVK